MEEVYIILSCPDSIPSKFIKLFTREPFSHTSFCLDAKLDPFYSFGRRSRYNILNGGFVKEQIGQGILGNGNVHCRVCRVSVTKEQKQKMAELLEGFIEKEPIYKYNFKGFFGSKFNYYPKSETKYFCSQFVAYLFEECGRNIIGKEYVKALPVDFRKCEELETVYEGFLNDYPSFCIREEQVICDTADMA